MGKIKCMKRSLNKLLARNNAKSLLGSVSSIFSKRLPVTAGFTLRVGVAAGIVLTNALEDSEEEEKIYQKQKEKEEEKTEDKGKEKGEEETKEKEREKTVDKKKEKKGFLELSDSEVYDISDDKEFVYIYSPYVRKARNLFYDDKIIVLVPPDQPKYWKEVYGSDINVVVEFYNKDTPQYGLSLPKSSFRLDTKESLELFIELARRAEAKKLPEVRREQLTKTAHPFFRKWMIESFSKNNIILRVTQDCNILPAQAGEYFCTLYQPPYSDDPEAYITAETSAYYFPGKKTPEFFSELTREAWARYLWGIGDSQLAMSYTLTTFQFKMFIMFSQLSEKDMKRAVMAGINPRPVKIWSLEQLDNVMASLDQLDKQLDE